MELTDTNFNLFFTDTNISLFVKLLAKARNGQAVTLKLNFICRPSERYVQFHTAAHQTHVTHCEQQDEGPKMKPREFHFVQLFVRWERSLFKINNPTGYIHGKPNAGLCFILDKERFSRSRWPRGLRRGICGHSLVGNAGSNPAGDMDVGLL